MHRLKQSMEGLLVHARSGFGSWVERGEKAPSPALSAEGKKKKGKKDGKEAAEGKASKKNAAGIASKKKVKQGEKEGSVSPKKSAKRVPARAAPAETAKGHYQKANRGNFLWNNKEFLLFALCSFAALVLIPVSVLVKETNFGAMLQQTAYGTKVMGWLPVFPVPASLGATLANFDPTGQYLLRDQHHGGRRLATSTGNSFDFYTKDVVILCIWDNTPITTDDMASAYLAIPSYGLNSDTDRWRIEAPYGYVTKKNGTDATECIAQSDSSFTGDQFDFRLYTVEDSNSGKSASEIASEHVDYVKYQTSDFYTTIAASANSYAGVRRALQASDAPTTPPTTTTTTDPLVAADPDRMFVSTLGFIVGFFETTPETPQEATPASHVSGTVSLAGHDVWWPWWMWLVYLAIVLICLLPLGLFVCRTKREVALEEMEDTIVAKRRAQEGLNKIYGPEYGVTEVDFDENYMDYNDQDMEDEYKDVHTATNTNPAVYNDSSHRAKRAGQDVTDAAWTQESSVAQSEWADKPMKAGASGRGAKGGSTDVRRFDIDDDDDAADDDNKRAAKFEIDDN